VPTVTRCQTWKVANLIILRERLLFATFFTLTVSNHKSESSFWFRMELSIKLFSSSSTRSRLWWNERYEKKVEFAKSNFQGSDLLHTLGVETHNLDPALYFVPWILFNGVRRYILKKLKISPHPFSFAFSFFYQSKFLHLLIHISSSSHKKSKISVPRFNLADFSGTICSCFSSSSGLFSTFGKTFCTLENWIVIFSSRGKGKILEHENAAV